MPARLDVISGQGQTATVATELPLPLNVRVVNSSNEPIAGQIINFRVVSGGGTVFAGAALTNAEGIAKDRWTLGTAVADSQIVEARAVDPESGTALLFGRFVATATPGSASMATIVRGNAQSAFAGTTLADSLVVMVSDVYGNPIAGAPASWGTLSGGTLAGAATVTNSAGLAAATWTLGPSMGTQTAQFSSGTLGAEFSATGTQEPISVSIYAGDTQLASPGTAVATAPAVLALDGNGQPKAGVTIRFAVTAGGGSVTGADAVSDANGIATVGSWTVGPEQVAQTLSATSPSGSVVTFTATSLINALARYITKFDGDGQTAAPGAPVAVSPAVYISDSQGRNVPGVKVIFSVTTGGGTLTGDTVVTDANGHARVGSWTLGNTTGFNTLSVSAENAESVTFTATAREQSPGITVNISEPLTTLISDTVTVSATTTSIAQLAGVSARIADRTVALAPVPNAPGVWRGTLILTGVARDTVTLIVRATDINGAATDAVRSYIHDRPPRLTMLQLPRELSVARPKVKIEAACEDDDPAGCTLSVQVVQNPLVTVLGPTPSPLSDSADLSAFDGQLIQLLVSARDSRNQTGSAYAFVRVFVESSNRLQLVAAGEGDARDLSAGRLLSDFRLETYAFATTNFAVIQHLTTGIADTVHYEGNTTNEGVYLTPTGAALQTTQYVFVSRNGSTSRDPIQGGTERVFAAGDFITYHNLQTLYRMNVVTGEKIVIDNPVGFTSDVAENGDVVYTVGSEVFRHRSGIRTQITNSAGAFTNSDPLTDGVNIVFRRKATTGSSMSVWLFDGTGETLLATHSGSASRNSDYAVENGWTAFTKPDNSGFKQVWIRSPAGELRAVSSFGTSSVIRALGSNGSVVYDNGNNRYLATADGAVSRIASALGRVLWRDQRFVVLIGTSAFAVVP